MGAVNENDIPGTFVVSTAVVTAHGPYGRPLCRSVKESAAPLARVKSR